MSAEPSNKGKRRVLVAATSAVAAVGAAYALAPFVASMNPSARARAAGGPVEADISHLEPGALLRVKWRVRASWNEDRQGP
jgi:ubiquinol-cytochrome c reductase iron-sulfur subunit